MSSLLHYGNYLMPLVVALCEDNRTRRLERYAGVAFFLKERQWLATCKHVVQACTGKDEVLLAKNLVTGEFHEILETRVHPKKDFAICRVPDQSNQEHFNLTKEIPSLGTDVQVLGFTNRGKDAGNVVIDARLFKGYVSRQSPTPLTPDSSSTLEFSFPALKGFSGAPVHFGPDNAIAGMLFTNHESTIELYQYAEVTEPGEKLTESIHRVIEHALAHSAPDIRSFLSELGLPQ